MARFLQMKKPSSENTTGKENSTEQQQSMHKKLPLKRARILAERKKALEEKRKKN
jgi:hypothetical protein